MVRLDSERLVHVKVKAQAALNYAVMSLLFPLPPEHASQLVTQ